MPNLTTVIEKAANDFAQAILAAVRNASLQELLALQGETPAPRRGRPPKAKPGRKPGRPPKATAEKPVRKPAKKAGKKRGRPAKVVAKKAIKVPAKKKRKINYPKCSVPGCGKNRWARGNGMCGEHFKATQGKE